MRVAEAAAALAKAAATEAEVSRRAEKDRMAHKLALEKLRSEAAKSAAAVEVSNNALHIKQLDLKLSNQKGEQRTLLADRRQDQHDAEQQDRLDTIAARAGASVSCMQGIQDHKDFRAKKKEEVVGKRKSQILSNMRAAEDLASSHLRGSSARPLARPSAIGGYENTGDSPTLLSLALLRSPLPFVLDTTTPFLFFASPLSPLSRCRM